MRLLVIEGDSIDLSFLERIIRSTFLHAETVSARSLAEAAETLRQDVSFHAIVCSVNLPDSSGRGTTQEIYRWSAGIPIVAILDEDDRRFARQAIAAGIQDVIVRSQINTSSLERSIRYSIERRKLALRNERLLESLGESEGLLRIRTQKLERACKTAQRFVENVSHDFRTPLTVIMEYAALISDGIAGEINDEQRKLLGVVDDRAADLNQMVDDILDASKLESGMLSASRTRVELRDVVDRALPGLEKKAELREVDLVVDIPDDLPAVFCDDEKAGRVLINLAVNAIKFTRGGGKVIIRARTSGEEEVLVEVEDNGIGIPETKLNEIFNRFSQVKPRETSVDMKGFGIGLSIAQELVGLNLGAMQVESREGVGSRFGFTVPINRREVVTRKFLDRLTRLEHAPFVSLFRVKLPESATSLERDDVEQFLIYFIRRNDLLIPESESSWLLLASASSAQTSSFLDRMKADRDKLNRNRPRGPIPDFSIECVRVEAIDAEPRMILQEFHPCSEPSENRYATC